MAGSPNPNSPRWFETRWFLLGLLLVAPFAILGIELVYYQWIIPDSFPPSRAGLFGDTFGAVTAFFTGIGFAATAAIIFYQLQDIKRRAQERIDTAILQRQVTTMSMVYDLEIEFGSERMRKLRHIACDFFLKAEKATSSAREPTRKEELAVRDTLYFLERVAHFTNEELVDDDLVLSVFGSRLLVYWKYTDRYVLRVEDISPSSLRLRELRRSLRLTELRRLSECEEIGIQRWLRSANRDADIDDWYDNNELRERLKREHLRNSRVHDRIPFIRRIF